MKNRMASRKKKSRSFTATDTNLDEFLSHKDERSVDEFLMGGNFSMDATRF